MYAKKPFGGPLQVLEYLGGYTHKVAITAHRITAIDEKNNTITFKYKGYHARGTKQEQQEMTLPITEFNRRFEQHILPHRFVKVRHYGYLKNYKRTERLKVKRNVYAAKVAAGATQSTGAGKSTDWKNMA